MLDYSPWDKTALEASPTLLDWIHSWAGDLESLEPADWFIRAHDISGGYFDSRYFWRNRIKAGRFLWSPPPAVAHVAIEQLRISRLKRQRSLHVFVVPTLFCHLLRKQLGKACDLIVTIPPTFKFWPENTYESLTIGVCFPFL